MNKWARSMNNMMSVIPKKSTKIIHVETELGVINITLNLTDRLGRKVEHIEMFPDKYAGELKVIRTRNRFIQLKTVKA